MAICLGINEDIIKLFNRYDDLKAKKKPDSFISSFHTDYAEYNLNNLKEKKVNSKNFVNENPFDFFDNNNNNKMNSNSQVVGNTGNNLNLIDFGFGNENNNSNSNLNKNENNAFDPFSNSNFNNQSQGQGNKNDVGDIFDILNQMNK